jgi:NADH-quinone oxidoreductase subunit F
MDLRLRSTPPSTVERAAVDAVLGPPDVNRVHGGQAMRAQRHLLLPTLHAVQDRRGWISPEALDYICQRLAIPPAEAYGVASFYALLSLLPQPPVVAHVCDDLACLTRGAHALCADMEYVLGPAGVPSTNGQVTWHRSPCLGLCDRAPAVRPRPGSAPTGCRRPATRPSLSASHRHTGECYLPE